MIVIYPRNENEKLPLDLTKLERRDDVNKVNLCSLIGIVDDILFVQIVSKNGFIHTFTRKKNYLLIESFI